MDQLQQRRALNRGLGNGFALAFDIAVTTAVFVVVGLLADNWLGTKPVLTILASVFVIVGNTLRMFYSYDAQMKRHEEERRRQLHGGAAINTPPIEGERRQRLHGGASLTAIAAPVTGPATERQVANDLAKRGLLVAPLVILVCGAVGGVNGAVSSAYAIALVVLNFLFAAALITFAARISLATVMFAALFGYLLRLGLIFLAVFIVRDAGWVSLATLGFTIIVTHLGLLVWELRYVSATLAYPGLKPTGSSKN